MRSIYVILQIRKYYFIFSGEFKLKTTVVTMFLPRASKGLDYGGMEKVCVKF